jgi:predicted DNA-binding transcriptional regulator AlpA
MSDRLLTGAEVAQRLNMPQATLRYWRHIGEGPRSFRLGPRRVMYLERDVEDWLREQYRAEQAAVATHRPAKTVPSREPVTVRRD